MYIKVATYTVTQKPNKLIVHQVFCHERDFMLSLSYNNQAGAFGAFNFTSKYLDDSLNIDIPYFERIAIQIYPTDLQLNKSNTFAKLLPRTNMRYNKKKTTENNSTAKPNVLCEVIKGDPCDMQLEIKEKVRTKKIN